MYEVNTAITRDMSYYKYLLVIK